jgi:hypothetical protein
MEYQGVLQARRARGDWDLDDDAKKRVEELVKVVKQELPCILASYWGLVLEEIARERHDTLKGLDQNLGPFIPKPHKKRKTSGGGSGGAEEMKGGEEESGEEGEEEGEEEGGEEGEEEEEEEGFVTEV